MSLKRKVIASYLGSGWSALMGLAFVPLYVRYLGIESYGLIGFFATLQVWLSVLDMGLAATLNREMARFSAGSSAVKSIHDLLKSTEIVYAGVACTLAISVASLAPWIATHWLNAKALDAGTVARSIMLMGLVIAIQWMGTLYRSGLLGLQRQVWLSTVTAATATTRAVGSAVVLAFVSPTVTAFFIVQGAVSAAEALILGWHLRRSLPRSPLAHEFSVHSLQQVWRFAGGLTIIGLLATLLTQLDKILLARLLPLDEFGYFMLMATAVGALSVFIVPILNVAYPRFAEIVASSDRRGLVSEYHKFAQLLSVGVLPFALMLMFFPREIIYLWTGDPTITQAVSPLLRVWALGTALNSLTHIPHMAQVAHGWTRLAITANTIAVAITIPALVFLVPRYGAMAAAWLWVGVNAGFILFSIPVMHTRILIGEKLKWYWQDVFLPLAAGICSMFALRVLLDQFSALPAGAHVIVGGLVALSAVGLSTSLGREVFIAVKNQLFRDPADNTV